jgi:DNA-binding transcriptional ArsR family regulator
MKDKTKNLCGVFCSNESKVARIKSELLVDQVLLDLSSIFKLISDKNRLKILMALKDNELCVCDLSHILDVSVSAVSHQLRILRTHKIVKYRCEGKIVFYSLPDNRIINLLEEGLNYSNKSK